jgi:hypothetical protein
MKRWLRITAIVLGVLVLGVGGFFVYRIGPRNVIGMLRYDTRKEGALQVGHAAPDVVVTALDGSSPVHLRDRIGAKPLVVVFGSFT